MKKKGFTLIELLAVILILGIIALIAIPTVTNIIKESKKGAFKATVQNLMNAVETECQLEQMKGEEITLTYTFTDGEVGNDLNIKGSLPKSGTITVDDNCNITVNVSDGTFTASKSSGSDVVNITEAGEFVYTCKRATTLHKETCEWTSENLLAWYSEETGTTATEETFTSGVGMSTTDFLAQFACSASGLSGQEITYGNLGTKGTLTSGDAFDCDVNGDGTYDSETERFYYVSDYYNTTDKKFEADKTTLIYYNNTTQGVADNTSASEVSYDSSNENWHGPTTAITNLPLKTQWTNSNLITGARAIIAESEETTTTGGTLPTAFDYSNYAVRLLTTQELEKACGITIGSYTDGELDNCKYLMENASYASPSGSGGYWLETPQASDSYGVWGVLGFFRGVDNEHANTRIGVRPVISLLKSNIDY